MKRTVYSGHLAALSANLIFGLNMPITKALLDKWMTPVGYMMSRVLFATIVFWVAGIFVKKEKVSLRDMLIIALGGFFGFILSQLLFAISLRHTTPVHYSLITAMSPIIVMLLAALFLKEPISKMKVGGVILGVSGAVLLISQTEMSGTAGSNNLVGILLAIASNMAYAIYLIITRSVVQRYSMVTLMKWLFLFSSLMMIPFGFGSLLEQRVYSHEADTSAISMILYVLIASTAIGYFLIPYALKHLRPTTVSIYMNLQPIVASVAAICVGQDTFTWIMPVALCLVLAGATVVTFSPTKEEVKENKLLEQP